MVKATGWRLVVSALRRSLAVFLLVTAVASPALALPLPDTPTEFVTDRAGVLPPDVVAELNRKLEAFEQESSTQVVVWVDRKVPQGYELEEFAADAFNEWRIGQEDRDNGVLFATFTEERRARIEVGYGLEGALPDAVAGRILSEQAFPAFREGDYAGGIVAATDGILSATRGEYRGTGQSQPEDAPLQPYERVLLVLFWIGALFFGVIRPLLRRTFKGTTYASRNSWMRPLLGSSSGGGSSGGGFSGGGGSSGGGGASGSW